MKSTIALCALLWSLGASAQPSTVAEPVPLELSLAPLLIPNAQLLAWELVVDGAQIAAQRALPHEELRRKWATVVQPGLHSVGFRVHYWRNMKTVVSPRTQGPVGFTFVAGGVWSVASTAAFEVKPGAGIRLAAIVDEDPQAVPDRLVLLHWEHRSTPAAEAEVSEDRRVLHGFVRLFAPRPGQLTPRAGRLAPAAPSGRKQNVKRLEVRATD